MAKTVSLSRRTVIRGMGCTIALPFLEAMGTHTLAASTGKKEPPRFASFYIPGAINYYDWFPKKTGFNYDIAPSHEPLARHRADFTVLTHLSHHVGKTGGHTFPRNWLTGHNLGAKPGSISNSVSVDQVAAQHIGDTYLPSIALSWGDGVANATLSRDLNGRDIPAHGNHKRVFNLLFPPIDPKQRREAQLRLERDKSILDTAMQDVNRMRKRVGQIDRQRLDQYFDTIRDVEKLIALRSRMLNQGTPQFNGEGIQLHPKNAGSMEEHIELMMDLIALAFQADMTRIVTQALSDEIGPFYDEYGVWAKQSGWAKLPRGWGEAPTGTHGIYHQMYVQPADHPVSLMMGLRDRLYCSLLSRLIDKLKAIESVDGCLLDHTILMLGGCQVHTHSGKSFPMILAGGKNLGFKHGQHLKWNEGERVASDLYLTILQQMGCPVKSFKESRGPISEILA
ncbi:MAG: DUF1552 domain-containing protein [Pirellulales bacterium]|nr:DUF1552 domain-containing protein [Pirellulales bacterium]